MFYFMHRYINHKMVEKWHPVSLFLEGLDSPQKNDSFEDWWETQWIPHFNKCLSGAKHVYIMDSALKESETLEELKENIRKKCEHLCFDVNAYMEVAWHRAQRKFLLKINDDE